MRLFTVIQKPTKSLLKDENFGSRGQGHSVLNSYRLAVVKSWLSSIHVEISSQLSLFSEQGEQIDLFHSSNDCLSWMHTSW